MLCILEFWGIRAFGFGVRECRRFAVYGRGTGGPRNPIQGLGSCAIHIFEAFVASCGSKSLWHISFFCFNNMN